MLKIINEKLNKLIEILNKNNLTYSQEVKIDKIQIMIIIVTIYYIIMIMILIIIIILIQQIQ